jgi:hypothetical protein
MRCSEVIGAAAPAPLHATCRRGLLLRRVSVRSARGRDPVGRETSENIEQCEIPLRGAEALTAQRAIIRWQNPDATFAQRVAAEQDERLTICRVVLFKADAAIHVPSVLPVLIQLLVFRHNLHKQALHSIVDIS